MKSARHNQILNLVSNYEIETQEELCDRLKKSGFNVTQATVSRDIRELKLTKMIGPGGRQIYTRYRHDVKSEDESRRHIRILRDAVKVVDTAENILVIRTNIGMGSAVGAAIDSMLLDGMVGCIAGDDTIMCVMKSGEKANAAMVLINRLLGNN